MVLQLTDITSEITDEELLEFTSKYYILLALHPVVLAANATIAEFPMGKREMFFWVDNALFPWGFAFYTKESLPRDERPTLGSYNMEDVELINENRIPINAYSEAFLCHMGISHYSKADGITRAESETEEVNYGLKCKRATSGDGAGSSKRVRHVILGDSASTEGEA
nr:hypothetical protein [Tanacetum cinerariifolium]